MEKRVLLAAVLSGVVVILWFSFFAPKPQPAASGAEPVATAAAAAGAPASSPEGAAGAAVATGSPAAPAAAAVPAEVGEDATPIAVAGDGWRGTVNPRGAAFSSLIVDGYKDDDGQPLDLVRAGVPGPLSIAAAGAWNEALYKVERVAGGVKLRWSDGAGNWVEKKIAAGKGKYAVEVEVRAGGMPAGAGVVVASGIEKTLKVDQQGRFGAEGAVVRLNGKVEQILAAKLDGVRTLRGAIDFAGVEDQYFLLALMPNEPPVEVLVARLGTGATSLPQTVIVGAGGVVSGTLYAGAKERNVLLGYGRGLVDTLSFGIFGILSVGFLAALRWIYGWVGNWGVAIIVLTAGIRILLFPLNHKSAVAMKRMQVLQPKMKAIQDRYKDRAKKDPNVRNRMNQEVMQLYKDEGVNPMGGCLPMLVQLPILWALYSLFAYAIELRQAPFVFWIHDLAAKDPTYITPILMTASMVLQQKMAPQVGDPAQRRMFMFMPFIFGFMFMSFPAGLVLYWLVNNLFTIGQQLLTERMMSASAQPK
jgi:YidC/Oxa1 family membrane protein insertase